MALEYYASIDLNKNELQNAVVHPLGSAPSSPAEGQIYYDSTSGDKQLYVYNGTAWITLGGSKFSTVAVSGQTSIEADGINDTLTLAGGSNITITTNASTDTVTIASTNTQLSNEQVQDIVGGMVSGNTETGISVTYDDAGSSLDFVVSNTTFAGDSGSAAITPGSTLTIAGGEGIDTSVSGSTVTLSGENASTSNKGIASFASADFSVSSGAVSIKTGGVSNSQLAGSIANSKLANSSITIGDSTIALGGADTSLTGLTDIDLTSGDKTIFDGIGANTLTMGASSTNIVIPGDLQVTGTITTNNVETISTSNGVVFEGSVADANELTLLAGSLTGDRTATLADLTGHVAIFAAVPTATITSTPAELNKLDGFTGVVADLNYAKDLRATGVTAAEFDKLDGLTASTSELNVLDGVISTTAELNILSSVVATSAEINLLSGITTLSGSNTGDEPDASTTTKGIIEIATSTEVKTGSDTSRAITASGLAAKSVTAQIVVSSTTFVSNKYAEITHNLGTEDVIVQLFDATTKQTVYADVARTDKADLASTNKVKISFGVVPSNDVDVIITSVKGASAGTVAYA
jgi:hypothetical protein